MANQSQLTKLYSRIDALEGRTQLLFDTVNNTVSSVRSNTEEASGNYEAFVSSINANMAGSVQSAIDVAKARILEELKAYVDASIKSAVDSTLAAVDDKVASMPKCECEYECKDSVHTDED